MATVKNEAWEKVKELTKQHAQIADELKKAAKEIDIKSVTSVLSAILDDARDTFKKISEIIPAEKILRQAAIRKALAVFNLQPITSAPVKERKSSAGKKASGEGNGIRKGGREILEALRKGTKYTVEEIQEAAKKKTSPRQTVYGLAEKGFLEHDKAKRNRKFWIK